MRAQDIARLLAEQSLRFVQDYFPSGVQQGQYWCIGSIKGEAGQSLKICLNGAKAGIWCDFATGDKGDLLELLRLNQNTTLNNAIQMASDWLGVKTSPQAFMHKAAKTFELPPKPRCHKLTKGSKVFNYLTEERKLMLEVLQAYQIGETDTGMIFPYLRDDQLIMAKSLLLARNNGKKQISVTKNSEPCLFGWQVLPKHTREITLCEGEVDAMTLHQYGIPALSVPFGGGSQGKHAWLEYEFERLNIFDQIYLCFDNDAEGQKAVGDLLDRLGRHRCRLVQLPHKDANACLQANMTADEIKSYFDNALTLDPNELKLAADFTEDAKKFLRELTSPSTGITPPWLHIQNKVRFRPGELSVWTGINGHGKSQFLSHIMLESMKQGAKVCIASMELKPGQILARMMRQAGALAMPSNDYITAIEDWYYDKLWLFNVQGTAQSKRLLEVFTYGRQRYGIDVFLIDSLMKCGISDDDYSAQKQFVDALCQFKDTYNCHVHLVTHPRKGVNEDEPPNKFDVKGTSSITDLADNCFSIWRNKTKEQELEKAEVGRRDPKAKFVDTCDALWICSKQRNGHWEGKVKLWFDLKSYQFLSSPNSRAIPYVEFSKETNHA